MKELDMNKIIGNLAKSADKLKIKMAVNSGMSKKEATKFIKELNKKTTVYIF